MILSELIGTIDAGPTPKMSDGLRRRQLKLQLARQTVSGGPVSAAPSKRQLNRRRQHVARELYEAR
jgi:hypothetical protein